MMQLSMDDMMATELLLWKRMLMMGLHEQEACAGVTTGQLLCACVGSSVRAEYTVYGDAINLSARLMMRAAGGLGSVLCDATTHSLASNVATFVKLNPLKVCGSRPCIKNGLQEELVLSAAHLHIPDCASDLLACNCMHCTISQQMKLA